MALVLIGFMGAGKSSAARELAAAWGVSPLDSDTLVVDRLGHSIAEEFERGGEDSFRAVEEEVVCGLLAGAGERAVVSLGGGSVLSGRVRDALRGHTTVLLDVDPASCWERVVGARVPGQRPLATDRDAFFALHLARQDLYVQVADAVVVAPVRGTLGRAAASLGKLAASPGYADAVGALELGGIPGLPRRRAARATAARQRCGRWTAESRARSWSATRT